MVQETEVPKMCPILTAATLKAAPQVNTVVVPFDREPVPESEAVMCVKSACMWYVPVADEHGVIRSGSCTATLLPSAIGQIPMLLRQILEASTQTKAGK